MTDDPYATPAARLTHPDETDAATTRTAHLRREGALRVSGVLCLVFGVVFVLMGGMTGNSIVESATRGSESPGMAIAAVAYAAFGLLALVVGSGLVLLRRWVRVPAAFAGVIGAILLFPLGTLLAATFGYLVFSGKGRRVLAADYIGIRARTPQLSAGSRPGEALALLALVGLHVAFGFWLFARFAGP